jgi:hypothetical protein
MNNLLGIGHLIEGVVEQDPTSGYLIIRTEQGVFDVRSALKALEGKEVRFTLVGLEDLQKLASIVEQAGGGQVAGIGKLGSG